jgi:hypothetical protein
MSNYSTFKNIDSTALAQELERVVLEVEVLAFTSKSRLKNEAGKISYFILLYPEL